MFQDNMREVQLCLYFLSVSAVLSGFITRKKLLITCTAQEAKKSLID